MRKKIYYTWTLKIMNIPLAIEIHFGNCFFDIEAFLSIT